MSTLLDGMFPHTGDGVVFGASVAISTDGTSMAVGNPIDNGGSGGPRGSLRVYTRDGSDWTQQGSRQLFNLQDDLARYVAMSSDGTVVAFTQDGTGSGFSLVREWDAGFNEWMPRGSVRYTGATTPIKSISLSGDGTVFAVGHAAQNEVAVFKWNGVSWAQRGSALAGDSVGSRFGYSVRLSADGAILAVGAYKQNTDRGTVRVFRWNGSTWTQRGSDINGETAGDWHGRSIALSADGTVLAVGAPGFDSYRGYVRVFRWVSNAWAQRGASIEGDAESDGMGRSVALSADGSVVAVGAPHTGADVSNTGYARVFTWSNNAWVQRGADAEGDSVSLYGRDLCLSGDGLVLAVNQNNYN